MSGPTLYATLCEDCGACLAPYPYGQVPLCILCRRGYAPDALRAWAVWLIEIDEGPTTAQLEALNNPDSGPYRTSDTPTYRETLRDAGRG